MTKIAVIGSRGWLGSALIEAMKDYTVRQVDIAVLFGEDAQRGDVRLTEDMLRATEGVDAVIHLVAWHGGYAPPPTSEAQFDINVVGTFRVLQACEKNHVRRIVWASSISAHSPESFYGTTKVLGEDLCRHYHLGHDFQIAMMRYGAFTPCDLLTYGRRLLTFGVDRRDCVNATLAALRAVLDGQIGLEAYTVVAAHPLTDSECENFGENARQIICRYWPNFEDLLDRYHFDWPEKLHRYRPCKAISKELDWQSRYHFGVFLEELRRKDQTGQIQPDSPRWAFESGTQAPETIVWPDSE